jgi:hypothetical protein
MGGVLTGKQCARIFQNASRNASANYCIGVDGDIVCNVEEENRAWTSSSWLNDCQAITIEVSNSKTGGNWPISDKSWKSLVKLCVDICKRYNFRLTYDGTSNGSLTRHNMFASTDCPGKYLQSKFPELVKEVNKQLDGGDEEDMKVYKNGSTVEPVYSDTKCTNKIGSLDPYEKCDCYGEFDGRAVVRYRVNGTSNYKVGFCKWTDGIQ